MNRQTVQAEMADKVEMVQAGVLETVEKVEKFTKGLFNLKKSKPQEQPEKNIPPPRPPHLVNYRRPNTPFKVCDLCEVIVSTASIQHQWRELGSALKVPGQELDRISSKYCATRCHYEVMRYWITEIGGCWEKLVSTLTLPWIKQEKLAETIEEKYIQYQGKAEEETIHQQLEGKILKGNNFWQENISTNIDWKVLGLLLGLDDDILESIEADCSSEEQCQCSMIEKWINTGQAYWSVLVAALRGSVLREADLAKKLAREHLCMDQSNIIEQEPMPGVFVCEDGEVEKMKQCIQNTLTAAAEGDSPQPKGIAFVFGMSEVKGAEVDVNRVTKTFREELEFAVYREENTNGQKLVNLIKAAATFEKYPKKCRQRRVFYFSGHGGIDKNQRPFFKPVPEKEGEVFYIRENILSQFNSLKPEDGTFIFFFDCCLSQPQKSPSAAQDKTPSQEHHFILDTPVQCLVAYATHTGQKAWGDSAEGGLWTSSLCDHLESPDPEELSLVLGKTYQDVMKKSNYKQPPHWTSCAGPIYLKSIHGTLPKNDEESPNVLKRNSHDLFVTIYSNPLLPCRLATLLSHRKIIGKEKEKDICYKPRRADAIRILLEELEKASESNKDCLDKIFRIMRHFDELGSLVNEMMEYLKNTPTEDSNPESNSNPELLQQ